MTTPIWTLTVPLRPVQPAAPELPELPSDPAELFAVAALRAALMQQHEADMAAWLDAVAAVDAIDRQPVKTVYGVVDLGGGRFRADADIAIAGQVQRCTYVYRPDGDDGSTAHTQLVALHVGGAISDYVVALPPPSKGDLIAHAALRRWERETGGTVIDGHQVATDRDSQSKYLAEFVAIGAGLRADPSPWKFADGEFALLTNTQMIAIIQGVRSHVAGAFAIEMTVLAAIDAETITTIDEINTAFA